MKQRLLILLGLLTFLTSFVHAAEDDFNVGDLTFRIFSEENQPDEVWLVSYNGEGKNVEIPAVVTSPSGKEYPIFGIRFGAFADCTSVETVTISGGICYIGDNAFKGCSSLSAISIPESVNEIAYQAFKGCRALKSIVIPEGITEIAQETFAECTSLTSVVIPASVTSIGSGVFSGCESLASVSLSKSLQTIGNSAFKDCSSLTTLTIPASVNNIPYGAFMGCGSLKEFIVESGSEGFMSINGALYNGQEQNMGLFACPGGWEGAFEISENVVRIEPFAFAGCEKMTSLYMPKSLQAINTGAFNTCTSLMEITCANTNPPTVADKNVFADVSADAVVYVPKTTIESYVVAEGWNHFHDFREADTTELTVILDKSEVTIGKGDSVTLTAKVINPGESTIAYAEWGSNDPSVAIVDQNGKVTGVEVGYVYVGYYVGDSNGQTAVGWCLVAVVEDSAIDGIIADGNKEIPLDIYSVQGICLKRNATQADIDALAPGLYIIGGKKVMIRP